MDRETQEYYDKYFSLFITSGWKQLIEDFANNALQINSVEATKDANDMYFRKGQLNVLAHLLNLENIITANYEEANQPVEKGRKANSYFVTHNFWGFVFACSNCRGCWDLGANAQATSNNAVGQLRPFGRTHPLGNIFGNTCPFGCGNIFDRKG